MNCGSGNSKDFRCTLNQASDSEIRRLLIGAAFTGEYAFEAVALFNPSIVRIRISLEFPKTKLRLSSA